LARVSHKKVQQLIAQKRKTVTDRQFFMSRLLAGHLEDMAAAQTKRYGFARRVKVKTVWEPKTQNSACTDNDLIWINAGHSIVTAKKTRVDRYDIVCGLFAHELGHILYTDFLAGQSYAISIQSGRWFPAAPPMRNRDEHINEADIWVYAQTESNRMTSLIKMAHSIANILEDGYIESRMLNRYPGVLGHSLEAMREQQFNTQPTLTQAIESESNGGHIWLTVLQTMLSYVKYGEIKYGEEPLTDERVQMVFSLLPVLDRALTETSAKERWNAVNIILVRCWRYIKDFFEYCENLSKESEAAGNPADDLMGGLLSEIAGTSSEAAGGTEPVDESQGSLPSPASSARKRAITAKQAAESMAAGEPADDENKEGESVESGDKADSNGSAKLDGSTEASSEINTAEGSLDSGSFMNKPYQDVTADEGGRIPLIQTDNLYMPAGGEILRDDGYTGSGYANSAQDVDRLLDSMVEKSVTKALEDQRISELNDLANVVSYGDIHDGVSKVVHRIAEVKDEMKEQYHMAAAPLLRISKQLQRSIAQQLKDKRRGGKQTGLLMGRRLDVHALPRNDGRVFYKNSLPTEAPEMAIALLDDESGSMSCGDRATYARAAAIILYDFCCSLNIPILVYGHSTGYSKDGDCVDLYSYAEFDAIDRDDRFRLMDISARGSNRDGAAIRFVAERLSKRPEEVKILILVSDGQPSHAGYGGTAAEEDLRGIKREYAKKGILFIAAAIGDDRQNIERIYGDSYLDITDLNKLPAALTNVVKRHIRA